MLLLILGGPGTGPQSCSVVTEGISRDVTYPDAAKLPVRRVVLEDLQN